MSPINAPPTNPENVARTENGENLRGIAYVDFQDVSFPTPQEESNFEFTQEIDDFDRMVAHEDFPRLLSLAVKVKAMRHPASPAKDNSKKFALKRDSVENMQEMVKLMKTSLCNIAPDTVLGRGVCAQTDSVVNEAINSLSMEFEKCMKLQKKNDNPKPIAVKYSKRTTDILTKWMIENREHPFPDHAQIQALSEATDLTYSQVVNWTTNVRKRNLKATVENGKKPHHFLDFLFLAQHRDQINNNEPTLVAAKGNGANKLLVKKKGVPKGGGGKRSKKKPASSKAAPAFMSSVPPAARTHGSSEAPIFRPHHPPHRHSYGNNNPHMHSPPINGTFSMISHPPPTMITPKSTTPFTPHPETYHHDATRPPFLFGADKTRPPATQMFERLHHPNPYRRHHTYDTRPSSHPDRPARPKTHVANPYAPSAHTVPLYQPPCFYSAARTVSSSFDESSHHATRGGVESRVSFDGRDETGTAARQETGFRGTFQFWGVPHAQSTLEEQAKSIMERQELIATPPGSPLRVPPEDEDEVTIADTFLQKYYQEEDEDRKPSATAAAAVAVVDGTKKRRASREVAEEEASGDDVRRSTSSFDAINSLVLGNFGEDFQDEDPIFEMFAECEKMEKID